MSTLPRVCKGCDVLKANESYPECKWKLLNGNFKNSIIDKNTTQELLASLICKDCEAKREEEHRVQEAKKEEECMAHEAKVKRLLKEQGIQFYKLPYQSDMEFTSPLEEDLSGLCDTIPSQILYLEYTESREFFRCCFQRRLLLLLAARLRAPP